MFKGFWIKAKRDLFRNKFSNTEKIYLPFKHKNFIAAILCKFQ